MEKRRPQTQKHSTVYTTASCHYLPHSPDWFAEYANGKELRWTESMSLKLGAVFAC